MTLLTRATISPTYNLRRISRRYTRRWKFLKQDTNLRRVGRRRTTKAIVNFQALPHNSGRGKQSSDVNDW